MRAERFDKSRVRASDVWVARRAPGWVIPAVKVGLLLADVFIVLAAFIGAYSLREGGAVLLAVTRGGFVWSPHFEPYGALLVFVLPIRLLAFAYYDLYRLRGEFSYVDDAARVFKATAVASLLIVATAFLYRGVTEFRQFSYSRAVFVLDFFLALAALAVLRLVVRGVQSFARRREVNLIPTLVVGRGAEAALCIREMRDRRELGYRVIGIIENGRLDESVPEQFESVPIIGDLESLPDAIRETHANEVIITDPTVSGDALFDVMVRVGRLRGVEFRIAPSLFNCLPRKVEIDQIGALPMITLFRDPLSTPARILKRVSDIIIASAVLIVVAPFWLIIALLIKLDSRGPVLYCQERVGMDGRIFLCYKFRTMKAGADESVHRELYRKNIAGLAEANVGDEKRPVYGKLREDPRVTRTGQRLRQMSLDELPQFLNILRGDMSVVGPRPPIPYEVESYTLWHRKRLDMKPGLTGLWQVSGRNRLPFDEMVKLDLFYIENWSLLLDLKIILRTLPVMMRGDDAY